MIRKDIFYKLGGLLDGFGRMILLEFFFWLKGELKMVKLVNCVWIFEIMCVDWGIFEGLNKVFEYVFFVNKYKIFCIVIENWIEWIVCVVNWKLCLEKLYVSLWDFFSIVVFICCSVVLGKMLRDFKLVLNIFGVEYCVVFGILLGGVRSKVIILWIYDIDIVLLKLFFYWNILMFFVF